MCFISYSCVCAKFARLLTEFRIFLLMQLRYDTIFAFFCCCNKTPSHFTVSLGLKYWNCFFSPSKPGKFWSTLQYPQIKVLKFLKTLSLMELNHKNLYTRDEFVNFLKFARKKFSNVYTHIMTFLSNIMTFLLWSWYFHCTGWNSLKIGTQTLLIMENVLRTFYIFCDFFGIPKYFLYSTNLKIQKINF